MALKTLDSNIARKTWRNLLDSATTGETDIVVTRYGKPLIAVISYQDYTALQEQLEELRAERRALAAYEEWQRDPSTGESWEDVKAEFMAEGLIDG
ncbi:MAG: type II toxin-antitoxin system prevent-host-death family antitoxin [Ardenticatenaceae bacterium]